MTFKNSTINMSRVCLRVSNIIYYNNRAQNSCVNIIVNPNSLLFFFACQKISLLWCKYNMCDLFVFKYKCRFVSCVYTKNFVIFFFLSKRKNTLFFIFSIFLLFITLIIRYHLLFFFI